MKASIRNIMLLVFSMAFMGGAAHADEVAAKCVDNKADPNLTRVSFEPSLVMDHDAEAEKFPDGTWHLNDFEGADIFIQASDQKPCVRNGGNMKCGTAIGKASYDANGNPTSCPSGGDIRDSDGVTRHHDSCLVPSEDGSRLYIVPEVDGKIDPSKPILEVSGSNGKDGGELKINLKDPSKKSSSDHNDYTSSVIDLNSQSKGGSPTPLPSDKSPQINASYVPGNQCLAGGLLNANINVTDKNEFSKTDNKTNKAIASNPNAAPAPASGGSNATF